MNLERRIANEVMEEIKGDVQEELIISISDHELNVKIEDIVNDYVEFFEEEEYDNIIQEVDRIVHRSLSKEKGLSFERDTDDNGYTITGVQNEEHLISVPGNYLKYYNKETNSIDTKCPIKIKNGHIIEIKKDYMFIKKNPNFRLHFNEVTFT